MSVSYDIAVIEASERLLNYNLCRRKLALVKARAENNNVNRSTMTLKNVDIALRSLTKLYEGSEKTIDNLLNLITKGNFKLYVGEKTKKEID